MRALAATSDSPRGAGARVAGAAGRTLLTLATVVALLAVACGDDDPAPLPAAATAVTIDTPDGKQLDARLFEARSPNLIVYVHSYDGDQSDWFGLARALARSGRAAGLTVDFRGYGLSEGERATDEALVTDVNAAVAYGLAFGYRSVVVIGASMGGTAAIIAAADNPDIVGVIALSPPARFDDLDAVAAIERSPGRQPLFAVIAARDDVSAMDSMRQLAEAGDLISRHRMEVPGEAHGTALLVSTAGTAVRRGIDSMLREIWDAP